MTTGQTRQEEGNTCVRFDHFAHGFKLQSSLTVSKKICKQMKGREQTHIQTHDEKMSGQVPSVLFEVPSWCAVPNTQRTKKQKQILDTQFNETCLFYLFPIS